MSKQLPARLAPVSRGFRGARPTLPRPRGRALRALGVAVLLWAVLVTCLFAAGSVSARDITTVMAQVNTVPTVAMAQTAFPRWYSGIELRFHLLQRNYSPVEGRRA